MVKLKEIYFGLKIKMLNKQKGNMYEFVTHTWNVIKGKCPHDCSYCLVADTSILMGDFSLKKIQDVKIGDKIIGINKRNDCGYYKFEFADATNISKRKGDTIRFNTMDGSIECTPEHPLMGSTSFRHCSDWKKAKSFSPYENLRFISNCPPETDELSIGWLSGFCDGDGCFFNHYNEYKKEYLGFEAVCIDKQLRDSFIKTTSKFGIKLNIGEKIHQKNHSIKSFNKGKTNKMIFSRASENVKKLKELIKFDNSRGIEFYKGYLAGMLDSDGSVSHSAIRLSQSETVNKTKYERIRTCLHALSIKYKEEKTGFLLQGGFDMRTKLLFQCKPKHSLKSIKLIRGFSVKGSKHSTINNISIGKQNIDVYNLETSCGNFIANGFIVHNCYMKVFPQGEIRFDEKELKTDLGKNNFIFVGSSCDMFAEVIPKEWILKILNYCKKFPENTYLFQTKNPLRFTELRDELISINCILGTTIETNRKGFSYNAPTISERIRGMEIKGLRKMITIEPVIDFDVTPLISLIERTNPEFVNIGADSKNHNLPEPSVFKIENLIKELKRFTKVISKNNLLRIKNG